MTLTRDAYGKETLPLGSARVLHPQSSGPDGLERLAVAWALPRRFAFVTEVNNTHIGVLYIATGFLFFLGAGVLALLMRIQLAYPGLAFLDADTYNQFFTMHGTVMMFLFAVPIVEAFAVLLLPSLLGTRDMPFPRLSALGYWAYAIGGTLVFSSLFFGIAPDGGWFMYPPLTGPKFSPGINTDVWVLGLGFVEISAVAAAVELIVGILKTRAPGMTLGRMPIFAWYMLVTAGMIMIGMPAVIAADILLELERAFGMPFYDATKGGDPLLWQHLFWLFGHPEVYIIFLPAAGMVSMMLPSFARAKLVGYNWLALAAISVGFLSFGLWVHHMFTTGLPLLSLAFFSAASSAIAIPMGIQVFAWIATLWDGKPVLRVPLLFILGFLFIFTIGGLTGVMVASVPYDWQVHDTYFVVAHFHYVLIGGMVFPLFAAFYYWTPLITGRMLSERLGRWAFWLMFVGFNAAFLPMHITGLRGMPRRIYTYSGELGWNWLNVISSAFSFVFAAGVLIFVVDIIRHRRVGRKAGYNPWQAPSLEWLSNQVGHGFRSIMPIRSRYPVWEQPGLKEDEVAGRGFLPDAPTREREALVTGPITGEPEQIIRLPGPGWTAFLAATATAAGLAAGTLGLTTIAMIAGAVAAVAYLYWLWSTDRALPRQLADAGRGVALPLYSNDSQSVGWWGMVVLLISDAAVVASFAFAYLFLWTARPAIWPPAGLQLPGFLEPALISAAVAVAWVLFEVADRLNQRDRRLATSFCFIVSVVLAGGAIVIGWSWLHGLGIEATRHSYGAAVWTLLGTMALHLAIGAGMALWCLLRLGLGMIDSWRCLTLRICLLWWRFTAPVTALVLLMIAGFPHVVS
ncbi:cytochrome c oxidase subunit I [Microvirga brassicacearum]|uniref:cytochrome-c oxidase n=1 Tax=Microvirga brassicacearum TaxID=2580413 RepID=A0A5N3P7A6_9HYPH|nr:cytochrome c oxidase subunit I [Microvirga brassicacearum]KAB0265565.1 cytochrome c oxidase subunit I [Microvirga brassicacearum]